MQLLNGVATQVRNTLDVRSIGAESSHVVTTHICLLMLNGRQVRLKSGQPVMINEGDRIVVAGDGAQGLFKGLAYRNLSTQAAGDEGWIAQSVGGVVFGGGGLLALARFSDAGFGSMPQLVASAFFAVGAYLLWRGWRVRQACLLLRRQ
jgi:hypothetical protein